MIRGFENFRPVSHLDADANFQMAGADFCRLLD